MKAILILNEMPKNCLECPIGKNISIPLETCIQCSIGKCVIDEETETRPDWCPLKPMPDKAEVSDCDELCDTDDWYDSGYADGCNACIDEILGDKE